LGHARRKFVGAQKLQTKGKVGKSGKVLAFIQKLYVIEKQIKGEPPDQKYRIRQQQAQSIIDKIEQWLQKSIAHVSPKMALGKVNDLNPYDYLKQILSHYPTRLR
jgi:transposase